MFTDKRDEVQFFAAIFYLLGRDNGYSNNKEGHRRTETKNMVNQNISVLSIPEGLAADEQEKGCMQQGIISGLRERQDCDAYASGWPFKHKSFLVPSYTHVYLNTSDQAGVVRLGA